MSRFTVLVLVLGCGVSLAAPLTPKVEQSSKKFFGKNLPADKRPVADDHYYFDHPYPAVQDTGDYDKDFVKDENQDGGKWKAQMDYDLLRGKVRAAEKEEARLRAKMDDQSVEAEKAKVAWQAALDKEQKNGMSSGSARSVSRSADAEVAGMEDDVSEQERRVEKEVKDLEACKQALADAKQHLKDLQKKEGDRKQEAKQAEEDEEVEAKRKVEEEKKAAKEEEEKKRVEEKRKAEKKKKREEEERQAEEDRKTEEAVKKEAHSKKKQETHEKEKREKDAEDAVENARKEGVARKNADIARKNAEIAAKNAGIKKDVAQMKKNMAENEDQWKKQVISERAVYESASASYDKIAADLKEAQQEMDEAAAKLKIYRRAPHVDSNGGVYVKPSKSAASTWRLSALVAAALGAALVAW